MSHKIRGFIEKAGRAGVNRVFIGLESINPDALKEARKGQNQITEYRAMLQAWHRVGRADVRGLHPGLSGRHAGLDRARHPHHPARACDRSARILHPDAAAGFRRSQEAASGGRGDGARPERVRPRARHDSSFHHVGRRTARDLPQGLGPLLFARARRTRDPQVESLGLRSAQHDAEAADVPRRPAHRARASAGGRAIPAQVSPRPSAGNAARKSVCVLSPLRLGNRVQALALRSNVSGNTGALFAASNATRIPTWT